jgi:glycosyltransferase involved in cell wall biosynthesis
MKICFISDYYYPSIGGTQVLCKNIAEFFVEKGHEIEIITSFDENRNLNTFKYKIKQLENLNFSNSHIFLNNSYDHVFFLCDLFSLSLNTVNLEHIAKKTLILNLDENVLNWIKEEKNGFTKNMVQGIVYKIKQFTNVVSFCKKAPINEFLDFYSINYSYIPNFSRDCSKTNTLEIEQKLLNIFPLDKKIIFNYGNIEHRKNQFNLINSFLSSNLKENYRLVILGSPRTQHDSDYYSRILDLKKNTDKNNDVILIKGTNKIEIIDFLLKKASVFVLPSLAEGMPLVLLEAMSCGLPWVSTPCGGIPGVLENIQSGKILSNFVLDPMELENAVQSVCTKNSRIEWEQKFTKDFVCNKYMELL